MKSPLVINVYDTMGQRVMILASNKNELSSEYSLSNLNEGIYFVHFTTVDFSKTIKLVVKR